MWHGQYFHGQFHENVNLNVKNFVQSIDNLVSLESLEIQEFNFIGLIS